MASLFQSGLNRTEVWMWAGPDERRLWSAVCGGRSSATFLAGWRWLVGLYFLGFQLWFWQLQSDPGFYASYLTEETMWLTLAYFIVSAATGTLALVASYSGKAYAPGVPPSFAGRPLYTVPWSSRIFWNNTLRAQQVLFGITISWEVLIVIIYWKLLWDGEAMAPRDLWVQLTQHASTCVALWMDLLASCARFPDRHVVLLSLAACGYLCVNAAVSLSVQPVYPILTWRKGASDVAFVIGVFAASVIFYFVAALAACVRDAAYAYCRRAHTSAAEGGWFGSDVRGWNAFAADVRGTTLGGQGVEWPCASCRHASPARCGVDLHEAPDSLASAFIPASLLSAAEQACQTPCCVQLLRETGPMAGECGAAHFLAVAGDGTSGEGLNETAPLLTVLHPVRPAGA